MSDFGADIQAKAGSMNRRALAKEIGISPTTLIRVFQGGVPDMKTCVKICRWLGVEPEEYLALPFPDKGVREADLVKSRRQLADAIMEAARKWQAANIRSIGHE